MVAIDHELLQSATDAPVQINAQGPSANLPYATHDASRDASAIYGLRDLLLALQPLTGFLAGHLHQFGSQGTIDVQGYCYGSF